MEEKAKEKQGESEVGHLMKMAWNVESVNDEKRSCGQVKNFKAAARRNGHEANRIDCYSRRGLRSSSYRYLHQRLLSIVP